MEGHEEILNEEARHNELISTLADFGGIPEKENWGVASAYQVKFQFEGGISTNIRILLADSSGADVVITNMTTMPEDKRGEGNGSAAIQKVLEWAASNNLHVVMATQIKEHNEKFWTRNGFTKKEQPNPCNDFEQTV